MNSDLVSCGVCGAFRGLRLGSPGLGPPPGLSRLPVSPSLASTDSSEMARRQVEELQAALAEAEGREAAMAAELAELRQQAENAEVAAQHPDNPQARIPTVRTHLPDKFEGRRDDLEQFLDDVRSYCELTGVPANLRVDYAVRCLGKSVKKVWLTKKSTYLRQNPGAVVDLALFRELLSSVYDNTDKVAKARDKLDSVYQGNESVEKYVERFTTLLAEVEVSGDLSMGEKIHRFRKGLREDLKKFSAINPTTGKGFDDLDALISLLTRYDAAVGGPSQAKRLRTGHGGPSSSLATASVGQAPQVVGGGQDGTFPYHNHAFGMMAAAPMVAAPFQVGHCYPAPLATVAAIQGTTPYPRRDGLPPEYRRDTRVAFPLDRTCYACNTPGHESWFCPLKKLREDPNAYLNQQQWDILQHIVKARQEVNQPVPPIPGLAGDLLRRRVGGGHNNFRPLGVGAVPMQGWAGQGGAGSGRGRRIRGRDRGRGRARGRGRP